METEIEGMAVWKRKKWKNTITSSQISLSVRILNSTFSCEMQVF